MKVKNKQHWTEEETQCFVALWTSSEVQDKLEGATRTKPVFEQIQRAMTAAGYDRTLAQLVNKLKKVKKEYWNRKRQLGHSGRPKRIPYFDLLDSVLGDKPVNQTTGARNGATADMDSIKNEPDVETAANDTELLSTKDSKSPLRPFICTSPTPSCSTSSSSHQIRSEKRKRNSNTELLEYLERSEERFLEQTRRDQDVTAALLQNIQRMNETSSTLVVLMERMVSVMEGLSQK
ncbi:uncharacterized protein LOC115418192 [Sphaeramia orbicularis]|uniref:uncharacterized protein LOC115418192 n=1 Tax=Sphaeramia orbicularis TaxID=375764 RepID=UPI00117F11C1|nr:uncharacterized protein LOC115418192 [Sphaeramia orbicularis]